MVALLPVFGLGNLFNARMSPNSAESSNQDTEGVLTPRMLKATASPLLNKHYIYQGGCAYLEWGHLSKQICSGQV